MKSFLKSNPIILLIVCYGVAAFVICASILNWDWFFNNRRAVFFVKIFGRQGARIFYALLGIFIASVISIAVYTGQLEV